MNNDHISRKAAVAELSEWDIDKDDIADAEDRAYHFAMRRAIRVIEGLPAADPRHHGKWLIDKSHGSMGTYCSECGARFKPDVYAENYNGCPMCFAVMKEV